MCPFICVRFARQLTGHFSANFSPCAGYNRRYFGSQLRSFGQLDTYPPEVERANPLPAAFQVK